MDIITHADSSREGRVFTGVCLSVYQYDISKTDAAITKLDTQMFHGKSWKSIYSGVKRSKVKFTNIAGVDPCTYECWLLVVYMAITDVKACTPGPRAFGLNCLTSLTVKK